MDDGLWQEEDHLNSVIMIKVLQVNLNRCRSAHAAMNRRVDQEAIDVCIVSEANMKISEAKREAGQGWVTEDTADSVIWWTGNNPDQTVVNSGKSLQGKSLDRAVKWITDHQLLLLPEQTGPRV